jgi:hypothetical protein
LKSKLALCKMSESNNNNNSGRRKNKNSFNSPNSPNTTGSANSSPLLTSKDTNALDSLPFPQLPSLPQLSKDEEEEILNDLLSETSTKTNSKVTSSPVQHSVSSSQTSSSVASQISAYPLIGTETPQQESIKKLLDDWIFFSKLEKTWKIGIYNNNLFIIRPHNYLLKFQRFMSGLVSEEEMHWQTYYYLEHLIKDTIKNVTICRSSRYQSEIDAAKILLLQAKEGIGDDEEEKRKDEGDRNSKGIRSLLKTYYKYDRFVAKLESLLRLARNNFESL